MKRFLPLLLLVPLCPAQNFLPNGDFEQGAQGWNMTKFNDPLGTTGVGQADVTGRGASQALYGDFKTLSSVMECRWRSNPFAMPPLGVEVKFDVMWEKQATTPCPYPSVNYVQVTIFDASSATVSSHQLPVPNQTGLLERASYQGKSTIPAAGLYTVEVFMRHSNLANMPYKAWVDNVLIGQPTYSLFGSACAGSGGHKPSISAAGSPILGSVDWKIQLGSAFSPTMAFLALGASNTSWSGLTLPFDVGGGCALQVGLTLLLPAAVTGSGPGTGTALVPLPIPNQPVFLGATLYHQWLVVDPAAASWTGLALSAGLGWTVI